jgi:hypothetical protein
LQTAKAGVSIIHSISGYGLCSLLSKFQVPPLQHFTTYSIASTENSTCSFIFVADMAAFAGAYRKVFVPKFFAFREVMRVLALKMADPS